jgi:hypothetical protein
MSVLHALNESEAVDELGIGLIRDGFSDILFPGSSTIQTRAKYFFITPYILIEMERENYQSSEKFLKKLGEIEVDLIKMLNKDNVRGVIGRRAKHKFLQK